MDRTTTTQGKAPARQRLEQSLIRLARLAPRRDRRAGRHRHADRPEQPRAAAPKANSGNVPIQSEAPPALPAELMTRLARLEAMVAALDRQAPATAELFAEWVRLRRLEEVSFAEFLRRRRNGLS